MRISTLRRNRVEEVPGISGPARVDRRTKNLVKRLRTGEVAVIDHIDLDRVAAESLVACEPVAVINAAPSISGRYPNLGPQILVDAGVTLVDNAGQEVLAKAKEGDLLRIDEAVVLRNDEPLAKGVLQTSESIAAAMDEARSGLSVQLEAFAANTMEYLRRERDLLLDGVGVPDIATELAGRHALIVVRGHNYREDIATLRPYIREYRPVLIGVDGGADALLSAGYKPHIVVGDMDSVSDAALSCGAEVVVHAYPDGTAPGLARLERLELPSVVFPAAGTSEDIAMLLADDKGASLIVAVGTHATLVEFLDKGRSGMASTFLTRLRVGGKLVDAKGVSRLYRSRISGSGLLVLILAAFITIWVTLIVSPIGRAYYPVIGAKWDSFIFWLQDLFS